MLLTRVFTILLLLTSTTLCDELDDCTDPSEPARAVAACSVLIDSHATTDRQLPLAYNNRANAFAALGRNAQALDDYARATALDPDYDTVHYNRGSLYLRVRRFDDAIADFTRVIQLKPDFMAAFNNRGLAHLRRGNAEAATIDFTIAITLAPEVPLLLSNRGNAWRQRGRLAHALLDYRKALAIDPSFKPALRNEARVLRIMHLGGRARSHCQRPRGTDQPPRGTELSRSHTGGTLHLIRQRGC